MIVFRNYLIILRLKPQYCLLFFLTKIKYLIFSYFYSYFAFFKRLFNL
jgi:hypothetical protein